VICVLQNGVEQRDQFASYVSEDRVVPSVVWFPAQREADASVWLRATPRLTLPDTLAAQGVVTALRDTRCSVDVAADFTSIAWRKLLQNAVAGLMVLTGRRAGMYSRADIEHMSLAYLKECLEVAKRAGRSNGIPGMASYSVAAKRAALPRL
jgi:2-dehydropantoate 2-reductase